MTRPFDPPLDTGEVSAAFPSLTIHRELGVGGQGAAFLVEQGGTFAALKLYGAYTAPARVDREVTKLRAVSHANVVALRDHGYVSIRGAPHRFALMEFIDGYDASALNGRHGANTDVEVRNFIADVAAGIGGLWSARVVHRDIKPANIRRRMDGRFVILDLGLGKHLGDPTITPHGMTFGTPGYMAPEQATARRGLTFRADLFSLGVSAYEYASGMHPYLRRQDLVGLLAVRPLHEVCSVTEDVGNLVGELMAPDALRRPSRIPDVIRRVSGGRANVLA